MKKLLLIIFLIGFSCTTQEKVKSTSKEKEKKPKKVRKKYYLNYEIIYSNGR